MGVCSVAEVIYLCSAFFFSFFCKLPYSRRACFRDSKQHLSTLHLLLLWDQKTDHQRNNEIICVCFSSFVLHGTECEHVKNNGTEWVTIIHNFDITYKVYCLEGNTKLTKQCAAAFKPYLWNQHVIVTTSSWNHLVLGP